MTTRNRNCWLEIDRRTFLGTTGAASAMTLFGPDVGEAAGGETGRVDVTLTVNGQTRSVTIDPRTSLLDLLRERLALTGAKKGCDHDQRDACTVHLDGWRVATCLTLAVQTEGRTIMTIEELSGPDGELHLMQRAFTDHDALQCGYCTLGQIMATSACVEGGHAGSPEQTCEYMRGHICRCGAYAGIVAAVKDTAVKLRRTGVMKPLAGLSLAPESVSGRPNHRPGHSNVCLQVASMRHDYGVCPHAVECTASSVWSAAT
ncbi:(2Fe-2S)-binding protein [Mesorhizobium sp. M0166]|uniref:(2Fe-2S)-binding protein n=1 Tax=Mesorhizobium sp. M0166 TaxID=2956902 RepID=UPI00333B1508